MSVADVGIKQRPEGFAGFPVEGSPVFTIPEMAAYLRVPIISARLLIRRGHVRHQRIGKRFLVPREDVDRYLAANWRQEGRKSS